MRALTPRRRNAVPIPQAHLPEGLLPAGEWLALILNLIRCVARDFSRIPQITFVRNEIGRTARHQNLIRRLLCSARVARLHYPTQARRGGVERERVNEIFSAKRRRLRNAGWLR